MVPSKSLPFNRQTLLYFLILHSSKTDFSRASAITICLSLKSVSEERRRDRLQQWKNEQRALQLFKVLGETLKWTQEFASELLETMSLIMLNAATEPDAHIQSCTRRNAEKNNKWLHKWLDREAPTKGSLGELFLMPLKIF